MSKGQRHGAGGRHTAVYVRVSSKSQNEASQLPDLERWVRAHGGPVEWYRDTFTGKTLDRPGWSAVESALAAGRVARVVVWRLDRLGRTARGLSALFHELTERRVPLVSVTEGFDLATPAGRLLAHVVASVAQYETEVRSERQRAGIEQAKKRGTYTGRTPGHRKSDPARARALRAKGLKLTEIAAAMQVSKRTVIRYLQETGGVSAG
jgi:DNA invertase Pin-like site-specific DNA recombinase